jgi:hypothetical protein
MEMNPEEKRRHREMQDNETKAREELEQKYLKQNEDFELSNSKDEDTDDEHRNVGESMLEDEKAESKAEELDD